MAAGARMEACSPNIGGDSYPARPGGSTAGRGEGGEGRGCVANKRSWYRRCCPSDQDCSVLDPVMQ